MVRARTGRGGPRRNGGRGRCIQAGARQGERQPWYWLALARALERSGSDNAAERALLQLRESSPEDSDVNLELARIAARRGDATSADRYYRNALYAPAAATDAEMRRGIRLELIRFLLSRGDRGRALSELLAAANDAADDPSAAVTLGGLFASAGDFRRAEDQFVSALRLDPHNAAAIAGAGTAAFDRGDYADAMRYLAAVPTDDPDTAAMRDVAEHVLSDDLLAARIGSPERRRRLTAALMTASSRLDACLARRRKRTPVATAAADIAFGDASPQPARSNTRDTLDDGLAAVFKAEQAAQATRRRCLRRSGARPHRTPAWGEAHERSVVAQRLQFRENQFFLS